MLSRKRRLVLAHQSSNRILQFNNFKLELETNTEYKPRDVVCQSSTLLLISEHNNSCTKGFVRKFDLERFKYVDKFHETNSVYGLAISSGFVYTACTDIIVKFDLKGNTIKRYSVEKHTFSLAINKANEIISSNFSQHSVTVMDNSGKKLHSYFHPKLEYPYGLDVNFSGNIFVAGQGSCNIHVLTPKAELLKIFEVELPRCIKFKENSNICFVGSKEGTTKVYEFRENI